MYNNVFIGIPNFFIDISDALLSNIDINHKDNIYFYFDNLPLNNNVFKILTKYQQHTLIINQALITGAFSENMKIAEIKLLYKKDDKQFQ